MLEILPDRLPWFIAGPIIGLCVVSLYALTNQRMGVTGSYAAIGSALLGRATGRLSWRIWFFVGLAFGAALVGVMRGGPTLGLGYGGLGLALPIAVLAPVLFIGGVLIGFGARWAGGCTSGHGISGTSALSPASLAATATFMATAVLITLAVHLASGGAL
jgi:uncharacterized membrane protein YedE/YeeE